MELSKKVSIVHQPASSLPSSTSLLPVPLDFENFLKMRHLDFDEPEIPLNSPSDAPIMSGRESSWTVTRRESPTSARGLQDLYVGAVRSKFGGNSDIGDVLCDEHVVGEAAVDAYSEAVV
jgi:hypothetical protein